MYKIMFVDDEEQNLFLMEKIVDWEEMGFRVCGIALDGTEGMQVFEETQPDLVFVDIQMEEMDGLTLIENLQKREKKAIYVIVTAYGEFSYAQRAISLGVKNYLLKPISRKEMIPMVKGIKEELDAAREKENRDQFINSQYETNMLFKAINSFEERYLKGETDFEFAELDALIRERDLCFLELFSPTAEPEFLMKQMDDWDIEYKFSMYDCVFGITKEDRAESVKKSFEIMVKHNMRQKYMLYISGTFSDSKGFRAELVKAFQKRNQYFYMEESCLYTGSEGKTLKNRQYMRYGEEGEEVLRKLIYNASSDEALQLVGAMIQYAEKKESAPDGLIDQMIELLISIKGQLTKSYQDRAFMILRHHNIWDLHKIRTAAKLELWMEKYIRETADAVKDILENKGNHSLMGKVTDYIWQHFSDVEFSAGEVAERVHLSRNYFLKIFKEETGSNFWDYVTNIRMDKAKKLLKETNETIYTISREAGYESQYHFSRKFKNLYGISPNEYRNL